MKQVPEQLMQPNIRFIKLANEMSVGKLSIAPIEKEFHTKNNYNYFEINDWLKSRPYNNYGVLGNNGLIIIDFDDAVFQCMMKDKFPETFTVRSAGKKLNHLYYFIDTPIKKMPIKINKVNTLVDIQGMSTYVAGPNSIRRDGVYTVVNHKEITTITYTQLKEIFGKWLSVPVVKKYEAPVNRNKNKFDCWDILRLNDTTFNVTNRREGWINGVCPECGITSGNKYNFGITEDGKYYYCFHCSEGGNAVELLRHITGYDQSKALNKIVCWRKQS